MTDTKHKQFLTPAELSERYDGRISVRTLANWRQTGNGPAYTKVGGAILYNLAKVEEWENRNTVQSTSEYSRQEAK
ncbi:Helix-turn-helix domain-containing protein [Hyphomicrobiales bacterium]|nr:Helix-turn-helix domain-containing protein [Hyphomicrobiales bacterium]CAH1671781.1 DNA-binding protein [Hyphomicrobiales bacterium]